MRKKGILFNIIREYDYELFRPIYEKLYPDNRLDIYFGSALYHKWRKVRQKATPFWQKPLLRINNRQLLLESALKYGVDSKRILTELQCRLIRFDLFIDSSFKVIRNIFPLKRVQIFHGFSGKKDQNGQNGTISPRARQYDALFCFSHWHAELFKKAGFLTEKTKIYVIGFPMLDQLVNKSLDIDSILNRYNAAPDKPSVLYAPSWNPQLSLHNIGIDLIEKLAQLKDWTVLVKPHPISLDFKIAPHQQITLANWLGKFESQGKIIFVKDHGSPRYLKAADVLITDYGTTLFEFMLLTKPILFYDTPQAASISSLPQTLPLIRKATHCFKTAQQAIDILRSGSYKNTDNMKQLQKKLATQRFYDVGGATDRAVNAIYELLDLEPSV